jgi:hypothetical protein
MLPIRHLSSKAEPQFWLLGAFVSLVFMTGGTSRIDAQSSLIVGPISIMVCAIALATLRREHLQDRGLLIAGLGVTIVLSGLHLVPLPRELWVLMSGRAEIARIDDLVGLGAVHRPLTLSPNSGWHAFIAPFVPIATLLLGIQIDRARIYRLLFLLIGFGALSGLLGLLQAIGNPEGSLYFYHITNNDSAVGLFANRNHAAVFLACLFPMLAVFGSLKARTLNDQRHRQMFAAATAATIIPLILIVGSRAGVLLGLVGLLGAVLIYRPSVTHPTKRRDNNRLKSRLVPMLAAAAVLGLGFLTVFFSRARAIDRLFAVASDQDNRSDFMVISIDLIQRYFPWGSGIGAFSEIYGIAEPLRMLDETYLNHVHNDWIETVLTFGFLGGLVLALAVFYYLRRTYAIWRHMDVQRDSVRYARLASIVIAMIAGASISDYPLRTPTMMCFFAIMMLWFIMAARPAQSVSSSGSVVTPPQVRPG